MSEQVTERERELLQQYYGSRLKRLLHRIAAKWYWLRRNRDKFIEHSGEAMLHAIFERKS